MPKLILACLFLAVFFSLLCGPVLWVALKFRRRGDAAALRSLRAVWLAQLIVATVLIFGADALGLTNPAGYVLAILAGVSLAGAALFGLWRLALMRFAAR